MGIWLNYHTTAGVPDHTKAAIEAEAQALAPDGNWWTESLCFFDPRKGDGRLYGTTKVFLGGYSTEDGNYVDVDYKEDCLMAYRDMCFIFDHLAAWSQTHSLCWELECAGHNIGVVSNGAWDANLRAYLDLMKAEFPWPANFEERVREIAKKYASRW